MNIGDLPRQLLMILAFSRISREMLYSTGEWCTARQAQSAVTRVESGNIGFCLVFDGDGGSWITGRDSPYPAV